jgi:hypothetical protein
VSDLRTVNCNIVDDGPAFRTQGSEEEVVVAEEPGKKKKKKRSAEEAALEASDAVPMEIGTNLAPVQILVSFSWARLR